MLHAAAMLAGLAIIWLIGAPHAHFSQDVVFAGTAVVCSVAIAARLGGVSPNAFASAPQFVLLSISRFGAVLRGALSTMRAALAADVTVKPALVRMRTRATTPFGIAAFADMISAAPGAVVVETDDDGLLVHVIDEDSVDGAALARLDAQVASAFEGGARS